MRCDWQIKNINDLLHIDTIPVPLGGVTEDRGSHLTGFYSHYNYVII